MTSLECSAETLLESMRSAFEGRAKIAEMKAAADAIVLETSRLLARANEVLARR